MVESHQERIGILHVTCVQVILRADEPCVVPAACRVERWKLVLSGCSRTALEGRLRRLMRSVRDMQRVPDAKARYSTYRR